MTLLSPSLLPNKDTSLALYTFPSSSTSYTLPSYSSSSTPYTFPTLSSTSPNSSFTTSYPIYSTTFPLQLLHSSLTTTLS